MQAACSTSKCVALSALIRSSVVFGFASCGLKQRLLHASSTIPKNWYFVPTQRNANCHTHAVMGWSTMERENPPPRTVRVASLAIYSSREVAI